MGQEAQPPNIEGYLMVQQSKYLKEFGAMLPDHNVQCMPD